MIHATALHDLRQKKQIISRKFALQNEIDFLAIPAKFFAPLSKMI